MVKDQCFPSKNKANCPLSPILFNTVLDTLATEIKQEDKSQKNNTVFKGINKTLFAEDIPST